jgi:hypothetical protein
MFIQRVLAFDSIMYMVEPLPLENSQRLSLVRKFLRVSRLLNLRNRRAIERSNWEDVQEVGGEKERHNSA